MGHTCLSVGGRDPWVVVSSSYMRCAAILGGPASKLAASSGKHSPRLSQCLSLLHRVRFGGPSERGLCATGCDNAEQEADPLLQKQNFRKFTGFFPTFFSKKFIAAMQASGEVWTGQFSVKG